MFKLKFLNPDLFQGSKNTKDYFEGYYYKLTTNDKSRSIALIPGISVNETNKSTSFIQVIDSKNGVSEYVEFPISEFSVSNKPFKLQVGNSSFEKDYISIFLDSQNFKINGNIRFENVVSFPKSALKRSIMGPFDYVPFMECNHAVLSLTHTLQGSLSINGEIVNFSGGKGYIEKNYGHSFPSTWVWAQANSFDDNNDNSFLFSCAKIPYMGMNFTGVLCFLYYDGQYHSLCTYDNAGLSGLNFNNNRLDAYIENGKYDLQLVLDFQNSGTLKAPSGGEMNREIKETISANIQVELKDKNGNVIIKDSSIGGFDMAGNVNDLAFRKFSFR